MVPLNTTTGRPLGGGRRPEDAPTPPWGQPAASRPEPAPVPEQAVPAAPAGLPEALAAAVLGPQAPATAKPKAPAAPAAPAPAPERDQGAKPEASREAAAGTDVPDTPPQTEETALVAVESPSAADAARAITWLGVTFRPPDVWRERQPSLKEEWEFVLKGDHLPEQGLWRAAARGYAAPAIAVITALHVLVWVLRSPARHATAWAVLALVLGSAAFML
ncbi:hypothetical protein SAMN05421803_14313 [Nocardiopsis flavescens]|uniref:Uncharacterized protein n=1 Tax=Nocardiopsis flavescens TaxID=758803 RepID=A0A1M6WF54_9ACTN|nr:hypothetical protein [Nocardiopsis flavescens]SHK92412.1 hypothetical protein SAMN05421803_14313 [Nocardiopsis flavescens]